MLRRSACLSFYAQLSLDMELYQRHSHSRTVAILQLHLHTCLEASCTEIWQGILEGMGGVQAVAAEASRGSTVRPQAAGRHTASQAAAGTVAARQIAHTVPPAVAPMSPCSPSAPANHRHTPRFIPHFRDARVTGLPFVPLHFTGGLSRRTPRSPGSTTYLHYRA